MRAQEEWIVRSDGRYVKKHLRVVAGTDLTVKPFEWLIEGILPARGATMLLSERNVNQVSLGLSMMEAVATKQSWAGFKTRKAVGLFIALSEGRDFPIQIYNSHDPAKYYIVADINFFDPKTTQSLAEMIKKSRIHPSLITVGIRTDAKTDMSAFMTNFRTLIDQFKAAGLVICKSPLPIRGAAIVWSKLEAAYQVKVTEGGNFWLVCEKMRSGPKPRPISLSVS